MGTSRWNTGSTVGGNITRAAATALCSLGSERLADLAERTTLPEFALSVLPPVPGTSRWPTNKKCIVRLSDDQRGAC